MPESIVVLLPIYEFNYVWLKEQLDSISVQSNGDFRCVVSHDGQLDLNDLDRVRGLLPDARFELVIQPVRSGVYGHIEKLIERYAFQHKYFVLCDQDDVWKPEKLALQFEQIEKNLASVISVNAEIVDSRKIGINGRTNFRWFGVNSENNRLGLVLNQLTGASGIYRSNDFVRCLPFPHMVSTKVCVHDHWLYLCALVSGGVEFIDECLWEYRQHDSNLIGATADSSMVKRWYRGVVKALNILQMRLVHHYDPVIDQGLVFQKILIERFSIETVQSKLVLMGDQAIHLHIGYLAKNIVNSRLESLRVLMHRKFKDS
jgi:hypothetical protein